jgi:hypothetical protein
VDLDILPSTRTNRRRAQHKADTFITSSIQKSASDMESDPISRPDTVKLTADTERSDRPGDPNLGRYRILTEKGVS